MKVQKKPQPKDDILQQKDYIPHTMCGNIRLTANTINKQKIEEVAYQPLHPVETVLNFLSQRFEGEYQCLRDRGGGDVGVINMHTRDRELTRQSGGIGGEYHRKRTGHALGNFSLFDDPEPLAPCSPHSPP